MAIHDEGEGLHPCYVYLCGTWTNTNWVLVEFVGPVTSKYLIVENEIVNGIL